MTNVKKVPLSLSSKYVSNWCVEDAIRELLQNALDQDNYDIGCDGGLSIHSFGNCLTEESLLLGNGTKKNDYEKRGMYGEGYKIALLVLCREGISVSIQNGYDCWTPSLEYSELYNTECLHVNIEYGVYNEDNCVKIDLEDLDSDTIEKVESNTLVMQGDYQHHETPYGTILFEPEHKGKVFVGGLFVDNFKSEYGFDFPPSAFPLDRDRKALKPFDVEWQCREIFEHYSNEDDEEVADVILKAVDTKDDAIKFADVKATNSLKSAAEKLYKEKYDGKIVVDNYDEFREQQDAGNKVELVNNPKLVKIIQQTEEYKTFSLGANKVEKYSVVDLLEMFSDKWFNDMSYDMQEDFEEMIQAIHKLV